MIFEIPKMLARRFGLKHIEFDLSKIKLDNALLKEVAKAGGTYTFLFDAYYNFLVCKEFGKKCTYWSGFIGGELAGSHLPLYESDSWEKAIDHFIRNNASPRTTILSKPDFRLEDSLPTTPLLDNSILTYDDQLDFALRQQNYIARVVLFDDYVYRTPFLESDWVNYIFSIPRQHRINKYIYKKILNAAFPAYFKLPTADNFGGTLSISNNQLIFRKYLFRIHRKLDHFSPKYTKHLNPIWRSLAIYNKINYINFSDAIRNRSDYKFLVQDHIKDLKSRNILYWLDLDAILHEHYQMKNDNSHPLILLTALEISLKSSE